MKCLTLDYRAICWMILAKSKKASKRKRIDWANIEKEYRIGQLSIRALARKYGVSDTAINKKAKNEEWERDLKGIFDSALEDAVVAQTASESLHDDVESLQCKPTDAEVIQAAVGASIEVIKKHRKYIGDLHDLADDAQGVLREIFENKTIEGREWVSGTGRESVFTMIQKLSSVREKAILLERQAYSLDDKKKDDDPGDIEGRIKRRMEKIKNAYR